MLTLRPASAVLLTLACLTSAPSAWADDDDIDVIGPGGRNSISLKVQHDSLSADLVSRNTGKNVGTLDGSGKEAQLTGVYSVSEQLGVTLGVPWQSIDNTRTVGRNVAHIENDGFGHLLLVSWRPIGHAIDPGFKLVINGGTRKDSGDPAVYHVGVQPQYRIDPSVLLGSTLIVEHTDDGADRYGVKLQALWRVMPQLSLLPELTFLRQNEHDGDSKVDLRRAQFTATYHLDTHWAVSAYAARVTESSIVTAGSTVSVDNTRSNQLGLGARYSF